MRQKIVFTLLVLLTATFFFFVLRRDSKDLVNQASTSTGGDAGPAVRAPSLDGGDGGRNDAGPTLVHSFTIGSLRAAEATSLLAASYLPQGSLSERGVPVTLRTFSDPGALEDALALGDTGIELAVLPFAQALRTGDRLRALHLTAIFVPGFSVGREALTSERAHRIDGPGKPVSLEPSPDPSATLFSLLTLDAFGASFTAKSDAGKQDYSATLIGRTSTLSAASFSLTSSGSIVLPFVLIAPESTVRNHSAALSLLLRSWLDGQRALQEDVPLGAKRAAESTGSSAAQLMEDLGTFDPASLSTNLEAFGLSGRSAFRLSDLHQASLRVLREHGLGAKEDDALRFDDRIVAEVARTAPANEVKNSGIAPAPWSRAVVARVKPLETNLSRDLARIQFSLRAFPRMSVRLVGAPAITEKAKAALLGESIAEGRILVERPENLAGNTLMNSGVAKPDPLVLEFLGP